MAFKNRITSVLRKLQLLAAAESIRYRYYQLKNYKQNSFVRKTNEGLPLPPDFYVYETYRLNLKEYLEDGKNTAHEIIHEVSKAVDISKHNISILDWGCGPGRIVRHLPYILPSARIYGTDYNEKYINWCSHHLKGIYFSINKIDPPLNFPASHFDIIIGISIFTHLSEKNHIEWVNELYRVMKPGGVVYLTMQTDAYRSILSESEKKKFDEGNLVIRENIKEGNRLYSAFQPPSFFRQLIAGKFEVFKIMSYSNKETIPQQDIWILQKKFT